MGRSHAVSSYSVFSVLIILPYAGLYIYLLLLFKPFLTQELFCNLHFYIVQNLLHGRTYIRSRVSGAAFNDSSIGAKLNLMLLPLPATTVRIPAKPVLITQVHPFSGRTEPFP